MSLNALRTVIESLDAHHQAPDPATHDAAEKAWKAAQKEAKETFAPLKALLKGFEVPASAVLQQAIAADGDLKKLADAFLQASPREVWRVDGAPLPLKNGAVLAVHRGTPTLAAFGGGKAKVDVFDLDAMAVAWSVKLPDTPLTVAFTDASTIVALLRDGRVLSQKRDEKKPRVLHELGDVLAGAVNGARVVAARERAVDDEGNVVIEVLIEGRVIPLPGVRTVASLDFVGARVAVAVVGTDERGGIAVIDGDNVTTRWLELLPSGGTAPPAPEHAHQFVVVDGDEFVITWRERAPTSRRWLRLDDLREDERFGPDFENVSIAGDAVWSGAGERVRGKRTAPLWFQGRCWSTVALADDVVVTALVDAKDKIWLQRWRRYAP